MWLAQSHYQPYELCVVSSSGVRPLDSSVEEGFGMSGGRPVGTTTKKVLGVSEGCLRLPQQKRGMI